MQQQALGLLTGDGNAGMIGGGLGTIQDEHDSNQDSDYSDKEDDNPQLAEGNPGENDDDDCGDDDDKATAAMTKAQTVPAP